jgi:hypothetical protein
LFKEIFNLNIGFMIENGTIIYLFKKQNISFLIVISILRGWALLKNSNNIVNCNFNLQILLFGLNRL